MEELAKQVRSEVLRTFLWAVISLACSYAIYRVLPF